MADAAPGSVLLRAEGIGKSCRGQVVLRSASLWAEAGRVTTLLGRNGSGKTTLMRVAAGRLRPDWGTVAFLGRVHRRPRLAALAREGLMYVPQEQILAPAYRIREHVTALRAVFPSIDVEGRMAELGVAHLLDHRGATLSGGERMRVSLAVALARRPRVLIIDEPLAGIEPKAQEDACRAIRTLAAQGAAVVTSGHDARALLDVSDVILWSTAGTTHHLGSPAEAAAHEQFRREYLGPNFAGWTKD